MPVTPTHERRFNEGRGERYMKDGITIRCHGLSKTKLRRARVEQNKEDTELFPNELFWPECQCGKPSLMTSGAGLYACALHGGATPSKTAKTLLDVLPFDLGQKYLDAASDPMYFSRKNDIFLLEAHKRELLEKLDDVLGDEAWDNVAAAKKALDNGDLVGTADLLKEALTSEESNKDLWREIYTIESQIKDMTNTEVRTAKELRLMASMEQVQAVMAGVQRILLEAGEKYINDSKAKANYLSFVSGELYRLVGVTNPSSSGAITAVSGEDYSVSE